MPTEASVWVLASLAVTLTSPPLETARMPVPLAPRSGDGVQADDGDVVYRFASMPRLLGPSVETVPLSTKTAPSRIVEPIAVLLSPVVPTSRGHADIGQGSPAIALSTPSGRRRLESPCDGTAVKLDQDADGVVARGGDRPLVTLTAPYPVVA